MMNMFNIITTKYNTF